MFSQVSQFCSLWWHSITSRVQIPLRCLCIIPGVSLTLRYRLVISGVPLPIAGVVLCHLMCPSDSDAY